MNAEKASSILEQYAAGAMLDDLLARYPEHAAEIRQLLLTVQAVQAVEPPALLPRADQARQQFLRRAAQARAIQRRPRLWGRMRWAAVLLLVFLLGGSSLVTLASSAVPGDALYGVKRWRERVELRFSSDDTRASAYLQQATERSDELESLVQQGAPVPATLIQDLQTATADAETHLATVDARDGRWQQLAALTTRQKPLLDAAVEEQPQLQLVASTAQLQAAQSHIHALIVLQDTVDLTRIVQTAEVAPAPTRPPTRLLPSTVEPTARPQIPASATPAHTPLAPAAPPAVALPASPAPAEPASTQVPARATSAAPTATPTEIQPAATPSPTAKSDPVDMPPVQPPAPTRPPVQPPAPTRPPAPPVHPAPSKTPAPEPPPVPAATIMPVPAPGPPPITLVPELTPGPLPTSDAN